VSLSQSGMLGSIEFSRISYVLLFFSVVFIAVEKVLPVALIFDNLASFKSVFAPVVVLLAAALPFAGCVNYRHGGLFIEMF